ncbi:MAG: hypothetical protein GYA51_16725, partial [Candidatus Methanofastidiosa archaeon]|nr:hypothetical protein [Candidatus Methanofastidiosa archaeon]
ILLDLVEIIRKSGFKSVVIFFDKIDEFKKLEGKIDKIVPFTEEVLKDTNLLYFDNLAIVFSIWTEVKEELNSKGVRFDKFKPVDITWLNDDIKTILQNRLNHFALTKPYNMKNVLAPQITGHNLKNKLGLIKFGNNDNSTTEIHT